MNKIKSLSSTIVITTLSLIIVFAAAGVVAPQTNALTVSPVRLELDADPGTVVARTIKLTNEQTETVTFYVSFENFTAQGETGKPEFTGSNSGLATWINAPTQVTLAAGEERKVPINIAIPADADPGGHFSAIFWGTTPPEQTEGGQVSIGGRLGVLILLTVSGDVVENAQLLNFGINQGESIVKSLPFTFFYRFQNDGNVRIQPKGEIRVTNMFGAPAVVLDANRAESNALPGTIRRFEVIWGEDLIENEEVVLGEDGTVQFSGYWDQVLYQARHFNIGRYNATLDVVYGKDNTPATTNYSFWILPWQLLSVVGGVLLTGLLVLIVIIRVYTGMVVKKALKNKR